MRPLPAVPYTTPEHIAKWSSFHHIINNRDVPAFLSPGASGLPDGPAGTMALSQALNAILEYCLEDPPERLCTIGSRWSLSNILDPANVILDPGNWNQVSPVDVALLTDDYKQNAPVGAVPVVVQGGTTIRTLNNYLGSLNLALQTSGANDGHRVAGCVATGTHGADLKVGAVHDTVLGVYLVTGPNRALLLQPSQRSFAPGLAASLQNATALGTEDIADDDLFNAARVALGALGFVHSLIVEAVPLYQLRGETVARPLFDADVWQALETLDPSALGLAASPDFFTIVFSPYASIGLGAYATAMWKAPSAMGFAPSPPVPSSAPTDLTRLLSALLPIVDMPLTEDAIAAIVVKETNNQYKAGLVPPTFPGTYFGPTSLPEGNGRSSEVVVDHANAGLAVRTVIAALQAEGNAGRHLLGGIGVRFVAQTKALLGMNINAMNTYIEFPSINSDKTTEIHSAVWAALRAANVPFTCHWGQEYGMDADSVSAYFGDRLPRWRKARETLLTTPEARAVFSSPLLTQLGLG
jgi:hypothetical protein